MRAIVVYSFYKEATLNNRKKVRPLALFAAILAVSLTFLSCSSAPYVQKESSVLKLVDLINAGGVGGIDGLTPTPFALDSETLYLDSDVATYWANLKAASFTLTDPRFVSTAHLTGDSFKAFADSFDMKNFFEKYTGKDTSLVTIDAKEGRYYFLLERKVAGYPKVRGMKGPVQ
jgi:hypothetical protein